MTVNFGKKSIIEISEPAYNFVTEKYDLSDESKTFRVLLDYAIEDGDQEEIFSEDNMRCRHC